MEIKGTWNKVKQEMKEGDRHDWNSLWASLIGKYSVSVLSAPKPALILKAFPWQWLPKSQFKLDLYQSTSLSLHPLSPCLCQVSFPPFSSSSCDFWLFQLFQLFSFIPLLPDFGVLALRVSIFTIIFVFSLFVSFYLLLLFFLSSLYLLQNSQITPKLSLGFSLAANHIQPSLYHCPFCSAIG